jgi:(2Fe-2S) ferredoxin
MSSTGRLSVLVIVHLLIAYNFSVQRLRNMLLAIVVAVVCAYLRSLWACKQRPALQVYAANQHQVLSCWRVSPRKARRIVFSLISVL